MVAIVMEKKEDEGVVEDEEKKKNKCFGKYKHSEIYGNIAGD